MERLTFDGNFCDISQCRDLLCPHYRSCAQKQVWERLKAYEDSGLSPQACAEAQEIEETLSSCDYSISRMVELMKADKDGRVVVLPCKVGDTVWRIKWTFETYPDDSELYIEPDAFLLQDVFNISKTVFLTREEAEKALQKREGKKDG